MTSTPPPGWFPDPRVPGQQRYWSGVAWTEHVAPLLQPGQHVPAQQQVRPAPTSTPSAAQATRSNWVVRHPIVSSVAAGVLALTVVGVAVGSGTDDVTQATTSEVKPQPGSDEPVSAADDTEAEAEEAVAEEVEPAPVDTDGDGVEDSADPRPEDPLVKSEDDIDTDGDGVADHVDDFPQDPAFSKDSDGDGVADRLDAFPTDERYSKDADADGVADSEDAFPQDPTRSEISLAMSNALDAADNYLDLSGFSRQGLIDQLSSDYGDGYDVADATWAVDQLGVSWNEQAVRSAKSYLDLTSFSRQGLIDQLSSAYGDQYTVAEATYAVDKIGL